ncbi:hypothetical protein BV22DRAFT_1009407 [Leucogyrophana mollusca]|uniref:Uncharacterized protein n=1 Tax=Leucogyrophana mollusca TaxID=85980 RepID=A0ACB8BNA6_9AGAM|nr:hypothetical protein BV22DRAFT_1009407 [Leucogyrophana mollusca]
MALRRLAQANNAANTPGSPHSPSPRLNSNTQTPSTPRTRVSYADSPSLTPSISSSTPFDWDAARSRRPPPYATPVNSKRRPRMSTAVGGKSVTPKKVVRKKGVLERLSAIPSRVMFEISLFPHNVPLPAPRTSAWLIGAAMHLLHLSVRVSQVRAVSDSDLGWEDMYWERDRKGWFDWTMPTTFILVAASTLNALHLFTQTRTYQLHRRNQTDPVASPHAAFVDSPARTRSPSPDGPTPTPSFRKRLLRLFVSFVLFSWRIFLASWRFLLGITPATPSSSSPPRGAALAQIQQLEVWTPGELERALLSIYSPAHALLWMGTGATNWMLMCFVMGVVGVQISVLVKAYEGLVKDRAILAAEVMHEYNEGFVYPRINPVRRDVAVMTHQSEMVNVWED